MSDDISRHLSNHQRETGQRKVTCQGVVSVVAGCRGSGVRRGVGGGGGGGDSSECCINIDSGPAMEDSYSDVKSVI